MAVITFDRVVKSYQPGVPVLDELSVSVEQGEFLTCIGPSGCGKTTFLKIINALIPFDSGTVQVHGTKLSEWNRIELRRQIGYVIQQIGLFPHMTVGENIAYVLRIMGKEKSERLARAEELLPLVGLDADLLNRYPRSLSGGQQQRVGVARALAADPDILLMDEPFGAVDEITRGNLQHEMGQLHRKLKKTVVFVTHDIEEAMRLGSRIMLLNNGSIEQIGTRDEMLLYPAGEFVTSFFGFKNFTSFLHVERIGRLSRPQRPAESAPKIDHRASLIEGVKMLFDQGAETLAVTDESEAVIGSFSLSQVREVFLEALKNPAP